RHVRQATRSARQPCERGQVDHRQGEEVREEPEMPPREALQPREERRQERDEALPERLGERKATRNDESKAVLEVGAHAQTRMVEVESAPQLEELEERPEQHAAGDEGDREAEDPFRP